MVCKRGRGWCPGRHSLRFTTYRLSRGRRQAQTADGLPRGRWPSVGMSSQIESASQSQFNSIHFFSKICLLDLIVNWIESNFARPKMKTPS